MPYVITTTETRGVVTRRTMQATLRRCAVATLDEAIQWVCEYADEYDDPTPSFDALASSIVPNGGTIGPLPDGTVIEVTYAHVTDPAMHAGWVEIYNRKHGEEDPRYGHCDTCGASCDRNGCMTDRSHVAAIAG